MVKIGVFWSCILNEEFGYYLERLGMLKDFDMRRIDYTDCIYYALNDGSVFYLWWIHSSKMKSFDKKNEFPLILSHYFDKSGKIVGEYG